MLRRHRAAHRGIWLGLAIALPALLLLGAFLRNPDLGDDPPARLAPPQASAP